CARALDLFGYYGLDSW
nr:immunoglobulin heavy chain junction region [Macaca mulatta]